MNYWITTHWPPQVDDDESITETGVWLAEGRQQAAHDMCPGDYVAVYEAKSGRTELRTCSNGTTFKVDCKPGRGGMICYGTADSCVLVDSDSQPAKYADGSEIWWRWHAPVSVISRTGFVSRSDLLQILRYSPSYTLRGFGDHHSGLKKVTEAQFNSLIQKFHKPRLPRGGEGVVHRNLKNYVASNPTVALNESGLQLLGVEYKFPTNDRADIALVDRHNRIIGIEIEPAVGDTDWAGPLQAIKYRYMLECATGRDPGESRGMLIAHEIDDRVKTVCTRYGIECYEISREVVDSWIAQNAR